MVMSVQAEPRKPSGKAGSGAATGRANVLDTVRVHQTYLDGDFDLAIDMIETARRHGGAFSHADSVFMFKHLGVMYAAKYETRELGKKNMMKLLETEPSARIMDMYASDMIYMIFKNIQDEFEMSRAKLARAEGHLRGSRTSGSADVGRDGGKPQGDRPPKGEAGSERKPRSFAWVGWTAGALAAAGGVALYFHLADEQKTTQKVNNIQ
jgi:hypothetical protein